MTDPETIKNELRALLEKMGFGDDVETIDAHEGATNRFSVRLKNDSYDEPEPGEEDMLDGTSRVSAPRMLIGERGNNLGALEHIIKKIIRKKYGEDQKFTLDINEYRMKRLDDLKHDIKAAAKEVLLYRKEVPLRPMSSFERRIVHLVLAEYPDITTESIGQEPNRKVIIKPYP